MKLCALSAVVALCAWFPWPPASASAQDVGALVQRLKTERDAAGIETIQKLAELRTREAMLGLIDVYEQMETLLMRREVLVGLSSFDGVSDAQQPALQKICDVATGAVEHELREAALKLLADCPTLGKNFLALIVESPADDPVRERAMKLHVERGTDEDLPLYERLFHEGDLDQKAKAKPKAKKGKDKEAERVVHVLPRIRELALEKIAPKMSVEDLVIAATTKERDNQDIGRDGVRRLALAELENRKDKRALEIAKDVYKDVTERPANRALAAEVLARAEGEKMAATFFEDACKGIAQTPVELRIKLAELLVGMEDKSVRTRLEKLLTGKADSGERILALRALAKTEGEKISKAMIKLLSDADPQVQIAAAEALAERGEKQAIEPIQKLLNTSKAAEVQGAAVEALYSLRGQDPDWQKQIADQTTSANLELRNAALWQLGKLNQKKYLPLFVSGLEGAEWSTRLAALKGLEVIGNQEAIEAIIARLPKEEGRMRREFCDALWRLTGQPLPPDPKAWKDWWDKSRAGFKGLGTGDLFRMQKELERRTLAQATTKSSFWGVRIVSHRVIFIIDVSGSMNEVLRSPYEGSIGERRIDVAKRELVECIDALESGSLFNLVVFSDGVNHWLDQGVTESRERDKNEAKAYAKKLDPLGGTNLYGALQTSFADPDVDTIYLLTDGEPTVGEVIDQAEIRERVRQWNEHRRIVIHAIGVGGRFQILQWLAEDSGGSYVQYN